jgi:Fungal Zn(2)-Cys(6) binuclear cluster domain
MQPASDELANDELASSVNEWINLQLEREDQDTPLPTYSTPQPRLGAAIVPHQQLTSERSFPIPVAMTNEGLQYGQLSSYESASATAAANVDGDADLDVGDNRQESSSARDLHRRIYQACDPCRKRKVKCDLGSKPACAVTAFSADIATGVDKPHQPPCSRCRREHKECVFSATRRKRKQSRDADDASSDGGLGRDKRRLMLSTEDSQDEGVDYTYPYPSTSPYPQVANSAPQWPSQTTQPSHTLQTLPPSNGYDLSMMGVSDVSTDGRSSKTLSPRRLASITPIASPRNKPGDGNEHMLNKEAANILRPPIATSHEALHLLSVAAGQTEEANRQNSQNLPSHLRSPSTTFGTPSSAGASHARTTSHNMASGEKLSGDAARFGMTTAQAFDPAENKSYLEAVQMWSRMRLVKDGWFTETEAIAYVD